MKQPALDLGQRHAATCWAVDGKEKFVFSRRWRGARPKGGSDQAIGIAQAADRDSKPDRVSGPAAEHAGAVKRISAHTVEGAAVAKQVHRQEIGAARLRVIPQPELGIITKVCWICRVHLYRVEKPPAADRVGGLRHGDALPE